MDLEDISEDETLPIARPLSIIDEGQPQINSSSSTRSKNSQRSEVARRKRNKKRNLALRIYRYKHYITRVVYHWFRMKQIKDILHQFNIRYVYVKRNNNRLIIGVKSEELCEQYQQKLPIDIFERENYYHRS